MIRTPWLVLGVVVGFTGWGVTATAQQTAVPVKPVSPVAAPATIAAPATVAAPATITTPTTVVTPTTAAPGVVAAGSVAPGTVVGTPIYGQPIYGAPIVGGAGSYAASPYAGARSGAIMPYSYYVNFPEPSRVYVGYGSNDGFPFYGKPYGHAGDRWSWAAMSTGGGSLAKYYYQILP